MHLKSLALIIAISVIFALSRAIAQDKPQAYTGAHVIPIAGNEFDNGVLIVQNGKIAAVGRAAEVQVPPDAERHDLAGKVIMPGMIDTHSHIGGPAGGDGTAPLQPDVRCMDAINVRDAGLQKAQAGGITT